MSLRNRNETRMLVENWRNLLNEGFNNKNTEQLDEGVKEIALAALMTLSPNIAKAELNSPVEAQRTAVELVQDEVGRYDGDIVNLTAEVLASTDKEHTEFIKQKVLKPWLFAVKTAYKKGMFDDSSSVDSIRSVLKKLLEDKIDSVTQDFSKSKIEKSDSKDQKDSVRQGKFSDLSPSDLSKYKKAVADGDTELQQKILSSYM